MVTQATAGPEEPPHQHNQPINQASQPVQAAAYVDPRDPQ